MNVRRLLLAAALLLAASAPAAAQSFTWQPTTDGNWNVPANWLDGGGNPGVPVGSTSTALLFNAGTYTATNDIGAFTLNSLGFNTSAAGTITVAGTNALTFAGTAPGLAVTGTAGLARIDSPLAGSVLISKTGTGAATLTGTSTFTGGLTVAAGRLTVGTGGAAGSLGTGTLTVSAGATLEFNRSGDFTLTNLFSGTGTIEITGPGTVRQSSNSGGFTGTVLISNGTFTTENQSGTHNFNAVSIVANSGGTYVFGNNLVGDPNLPNATFVTANAGGTVIWEEGEQFGGLILNGGLAELRLGGMTLASGTPSEFRSGTLTGPGANGIGGSATINKTTAGTVTVSSVNLGNTGALNVQDGVLSTNIGFTSTGAMTLGTAGNAATLQFTGGTGTNARPLTVNAGGGTVDVLALGVLTQTAALNLNGTLTKAGAGTFRVTGATAGAGGFTITGGDLELLGTVGHTGPTSVAAAVLRVAPNATASASAFDVAAGGTLAVAAGTGGTSFTAPSLSLAAGGAAVQLELNTAALPTAPLLVLSNTDGLALNGGTHTLRLTNPQPFAVGTFTAIDYDGAGIASGLNLVLPGRTAGALVYDTANTRIDVSVTGTDSVKWGGQTSNVWDNGTAAGVGGTSNFRLVSNNSGTNFIPTDVVLFDDTASGNFSLTLPADVQPAAVTVNNSANAYTFNGAGGIAGPAGLTKQGSNALILANTNTYTGGTTVTGGTLQLGTGGTTGSVAGPVSLGDGTTLAFNRSDAVAFANPVTVGGSTTLSNAGSGAVALSSALGLGSNALAVSGAGDVSLTGIVTGTGTLTKSGAGTLTLLANNNPFTGTVTIDGGTVVQNDAGLGGDLGAAQITVNSGGTYQFAVFPTTGNTDLPNTTYVSLNTGGTAVWNESEDFGGINLLGGTLQTRATTNLNGATAVDWQAGTVTAVGGTPIVGGSATVNKTTAGTITVTGVAVNGTGPLNLQEGVLATDANMSGAGVVTLGTGATAATLRLTTGGTTATYARPITLANAAIDGSRIEVSDAAGVPSVTGVVSGSGRLTKAGPGTLRVTGANTYTGGTTVSAGTLRVANATGSGTGTGAVDVSAAGTLSGSGTVAGAVTITGGTLAGGAAAGASTLTLQSDLTVTGGVLRATLFGTGAGDMGSTAVTGTATVDAASSLRLDLSALLPADVDTVRAAGPRTYTVLSAGTLSSGLTGIDAANSNFGSFLASEWAFVASPAANTVQVSFAPVPEPAGVLAVTGLGLGLVGWVRRRTRRAAAA